MTAEISSRGSDPVRRRLEALAAEMRGRYGDAVAVTRAGGALAEEAPTVEMTPPNEGASSVYWFDTGDESQVDTGGGAGGTWELGRSDDDAAYLEDLVRSIVAGRVVEVFGPSDRSRVTVTLSDGSEDTSTGYRLGSGCLPRWGWKRMGRRVQYLPWSG